MGIFNKIFGRKDDDGEAGSHPAQPPVGREPPLKTITYRGGLVTFRILAHWVEEYEHDGGGAFYELAPDSATFRLRTITARSPSPVTAESAPDVLSRLPQAANSTIERLPSGCALMRFTESTVENGQGLFITYWSVAQVLPPYHVRIANFSYTLLEHQRDDAKFQYELELFDREVRGCIFWPELGVTPV